MIGRRLALAGIVLAVGLLAAACGGGGDEGTPAPTSEPAPTTETTPEPAPPPTTAEKPKRYSGTTGLGWTIGFEVSANRSKSQNIELGTAEEGVFEAFPCRSGNSLSFSELQLPVQGVSKIAKDGTFSRRFSTRIPAGSIGFYSGSVSVFTKDVGRFSGLIEGSLTGPRRAAGTLSVQVSVPGDRSADQCTADAVKWTARTR
jgi:hypothetical protein